MAYNDTISRIFDSKNTTNKTYAYLSYIAYQAAQLIIQGSNDGNSWNNIKSVGKYLNYSQNFDTGTFTTPYRFIRIINGGACLIALVGKTKYVIGQAQHIANHVDYFNIDTGDTRSKLIYTISYIFQASGNVSFQGSNNNSSWTSLYANNGPGWYSGSFVTNCRYLRLSAYNYMQNGVAGGMFVVANYVD